MITIANNVLGGLTAENPVATTNRQLALHLGVPEPSVRRATGQLERKGLIYADKGGYSNVPVQWALRIV